MEVTAAAGETIGDDNASSSSSESESSEISIEDVEMIESEKEVDIINVSDEGTAAEGGSGAAEGGSGKKLAAEKVKIVNTKTDQAATRSKEIKIGKQKIDYTKESTTRSKEIKMGKQKIDYTKESTKSASSTAVIVLDKESSGSSRTKNLPNLPSNFPYRFMKHIEDPSSIRPRVLMEKRLGRSDVNQSKDRLSMRGKRIKESFLTEEEIDKLKFNEEMRVAVMEPDGETVSYLRLIKWRRGMEAGTYALTGGWHNTVARNSDTLKIGEFVRVWYFRVNGRLWFGLEEVGKVKKEFETLEQMSQKWCHQNILAP